MKRSNEQEVDFNKVKQSEHLLDDVMELINPETVKLKLSEVEKEFEKNDNEINKLRLGIIYHETALNLSFFDNAGYKGYAQKSYNILSELFESPLTEKEMLPFVESYRASALSLVSAETKKLKLLSDAFKLFENAVEKYSDISYAPEFLRGSVAENLPRIFFSKRKFAKKDFQSIIEKHEANPEYAGNKIMSFTYWAWANQHQSKKFRDKALHYLDRAIKADPEYKAGRKKAEELKTKLL